MLKNDLKLFNWKTKNNTINPWEFNKIQIDEKFPNNKYSENGKPIEK